MKKKLLVVLSIIIFTGTIDAQIPHQQVEQKMQKNVTVETGYFFMENGRVLHIMEETGMGSKIQNDMVLKNGTVIKPDGSYQSENGTLLRLRNGQIMDITGIKYKSERKFLKKTHRKKIEKNKTPKMHSGGHQQHNNGGSSSHQH
ncbi:MAG: hypothetical protein IM581_11640 [Chitinophagaceae bacterium]|nr:hypothetical protein [Chitinophagaceae bacterium]